MVDTLNNVSTEAVKKATGKNWDEWIQLLDNAGLRDKSHKEVVHYLEEGKHIESGWWRQMVTVGYEYARGSRILGETAEAGFEIGVQKTIPISPTQAWKLLTSPEGLKIWMGDTKNFKSEKGFQYDTAEGISGEIRSLKAGERIRLTRKIKGEQQSSTFQISLIPSGGKTSFRFHHEKLAGEDERERMGNHWREVLEQLENLATK